MELITLLEKGTNYATFIGFLTWIFVISSLRLCSSTPPLLSSSSLIPLPPVAYSFVSDRIAYQVSADQLAIMDALGRVCSQQSIQFILLITAISGRQAAICQRLIEASTNRPFQFLIIVHNYLSPNVMPNDCTFLSLSPNITL